VAAPVPVGHRSGNKKTFVFPDTVSAKKSPADDAPAATAATAATAAKQETTAIEARQGGPVTALLTPADVKRPAAVTQSAMLGTPDPSPHRLPPAAAGGGDGDRSTAQEWAMREQRARASREATTRGALALERRQVSQEAQARKFRKQEEAALEAALEAARAGVEEGERRRREAEALGLRQAHLHAWRKKRADLLTDSSLNSSPAGSPVASLPASPVLVPGSGAAELELLLNLVGQVTEPSPLGSGSSPPRRLSVGTEAREERDHLAGSPSCEFGCCALNAAFSPRSGQIEIERRAVPLCAGRRRGGGAGTCCCHVNRGAIMLTPPSVRGGDSTVLHARRRGIH